MLGRRLLMQGVAALGVGAVAKKAKAPSHYLHAPMPDRTVYSGAIAKSRLDNAPEWLGERYNELHAMESRVHNNMINGFDPDIYALGSVSDTYRHIQQRMRNAQRRSLIESMREKINKDLSDWRAGIGNAITGALGINK